MANLAELSGLPVALLWGVAAFALSVGLTLLCMPLALRIGAVARPREDRWHREVVPLLGGIAIAGATILPLLLAARGGQGVRALLLGAGLVALLGLADDLRSVKPQTKLLGQILAATLVAGLGLRLPLTPWPELDVVVTLFWIIGITNAFNLLDNMDGLAAGIAAIAAAFRLAFFHMDGNADGAAAAAILLGTALGFLVFNRHPARIFMGDAGSMFLGFFVAGLSLVGGYPYSRGTLSVLFLPVLLLAVPIFDTTFVTAARILARRPISVGGRDHTSHRLVALGLSEPRAVVWLYVLAVASGSVAFLSYRFGFSRSAVLVFYLVLGVGMLAFHLSRVPIHTLRADAARRAGAAAEAAARGVARLRLVGDPSYARQMATVLLDFVLIIAAYDVAYLLRYEGDLKPVEDAFLRALPVVVGCQVLALAAYRTYQGMWRYTSLADLVRLMQAASAGTALAVLLLVFAYRFEGFSRAVLVLDWMVLIAFLCGSRAGFRLLGEALRPAARGARRVLIYGAGDGGELALREVLRNPALGRKVVAFIDDDPVKRSRRIGGVPVIGGIEALEAALRAGWADEVLVASRKILEEQMRRVAAACEAGDVPVVRATMRLEAARLGGVAAGRAPDAA